VNSKKWRRQVLKMVEEVGRRFTRPDEDWAPVVLMDTAEGVVAAGVACPKGALPGAVASAFRKFRPEKAAFVLSAWTVHVTQEEGPLRDLAGRRRGAGGRRDGRGAWASPGSPEWPLSAVLAGNHRFPDPAALTATAAPGWRVSGAFGGPAAQARLGPGGGQAIESVKVGK
jgi:hypothetical protein